jgi:predicted DNA-binding ribbon-helix-helix protein
VSVDGPSPGELIKRSVTLAGHRTSVRLERVFWNEIETLAAARDMSLAGLVAEIDRRRSADQNLASALRVEVLLALRRAG